MPLWPVPATKPLWRLVLAALLLAGNVALAAPSSWRFVFTRGPVEASATVVTPDAAFSPQRGYGFEPGSTPDAAANRPFLFSVAVSEGNYRVTVTLGAPSSSSDTTVKAESRRLMLEHVVTRPAEYVTCSFVVNVRTAQLPPPPANAPGGSSVLLNERELGSLTWDDKLTLEFDGPAPRVRALVIEPAHVPTIFLAGDSTVTDQRFEPAASWGQMLPRFFTADVAVANHAESGETLKSFLSELRLAKILSQIGPGDWLFLQFGHNDEKANWPQTYAEAHTTYAAYLRVYVAEARRRGATPVLVTSVQRRTFDAHGRIKNTHGDYPDVVREIAREQNVPLVDLDRMSTVLYEALGPQRAPLAFNAGGKDATHHDNYGAYELARCVVQAIRDAHLPLSRFIAPDVPPFDPAHPDPLDAFPVPASPQHSPATPRGN